MHKLLIVFYFYFSIFPFVNFTIVAFRPRAISRNICFPANKWRNIYQKLSKIPINNRITAAMSFKRLGEELSFSVINTPKTHIEVYACSDLHADSQRNQDWVRKKCVGLEVELIIYIPILYREQYSPVIFVFRMGTG